MLFNKAPLKTSTDLPSSARSPRTPKSSTIQSCLSMYSAAPENRATLRAGREVSRRNGEVSRCLGVEVSGSRKSGVGVMHAACSVLFFEPDFEASKPFVDMGLPCYDIGKRVCVGVIELLDGMAERLQNGQH